MGERFFLEIDAKGIHRNGDHKEGHCQNTISRFSFASMLRSWTPLIKELPPAREERPSPLGFWNMIITVTTMLTAIIKTAPIISIALIKHLRNFVEPAPFPKENSGRLPGYYKKKQDMAQGRCPAGSYWGAAPPPAYPARYSLMIIAQSDVLCKQNFICPFISDANHQISLMIGKLSPYRRIF